MSTPKSSSKLDNGVDSQPVAGTGAAAAERAQLPHNALRGFDEWCGKIIAPADRLPIDLHRYRAHGAGVLPPP